MMHPEKSKTFPTINANSPEGHQGNLPVENCPLKHKRKILSASRDFPPGCGPLARRHFSKPKEVANQRRVSPIRDFPPFCQRSFPHPSREKFPEENQFLSVGKSSTNAKQAGEAIKYGTNEMSNREVPALKNHLARSLTDLPAQIEEEVAKHLVPSGGVTVQGSTAALDFPWRQKSSALKKQTDGEHGRQVKKLDSTHRKEIKAAPFPGNADSLDHGKELVRPSPVSMEKSRGNRKGKMVVWDGGGSIEYDLEYEDFDGHSRSHDSQTSAPPFGHNKPGDRVDDNDTVVSGHKVRETLRLFQAVCRKLLQKEQAKLKGENFIRRVDLEAVKILKKKGKTVNTGKHIFGKVPGVEIGDEFHYRVELHIVGLHRPLQGGIDYTKHNGRVLATSVVASGGYADYLENSNFLIYSGSGGNVLCEDKKPEDQKLERGNLALKNSIDAKNLVRVIRGFKETKASELSKRAEATYTYTYDGLYQVQRYWQEPGPHGKLVFKFKLVRLPGQPELSWNEGKYLRKHKMRQGLRVHDITQGKEKIPICAINTMDNEKPPPFTYVARMIYPDLCQPIPPKGCYCNDKCLDFQKCSCAVKNGGEIPYNCIGAIVEVKPLVYECGPSCKCSPSCPNRVSQHGIKFQLEIFKTKAKGWGVRSLNSIPSGSFICEYVGELLKDAEAEQRADKDEYLFHIGNNYRDGTLWDGLSSLIPDIMSNSSEVLDCSGFTIDAARFGNIGRFINHSCSPNLYAQNVLYDHEDKRIPHIMLFAAENIPPLQELTYHYNYMVDQVHGSDGIIKKKICNCGSQECTGRLY